MDLTPTSEEQAFRDEVRAWLEANHPGPEPEGDDTAHTVAAELLGAELARIPDLRLVYLSACHTDQVAATLSRSASSARTRG